MSRGASPLLSKLQLLPHVETVAQSLPWRVTSLWACGGSSILQPVEPLQTCRLAVWKPWAGVVGKPFR